MLVVVDELQVVVFGEVEVQPQGREPANVTSGVLEGQIETVEVVARPDAA